MLSLPEAIGSLGYNEVIWAQKKGSNLYTSDANNPYIQHSNALAMTTDRRIEMTKSVLEGQGLLFRNEQNSSCDAVSYLVHWNNYLQEVGDDLRRKIPCCFNGTIKYY